MSFPPNSQVPEQPALQDRPGFRPRRGLRPLTGLLLFAVVGSCTAVQIPREIGRWHLVSAIKLRRGGEKEAAYGELAKAMEQFPKNPELLLQRAEWRLNDGDEELALADCDQIIEFAGEKPAV